MSTLLPTKDVRTTYDKRTGAVRSFFGAELVEALPAAALRRRVPAQPDNFLESNRHLFRLENISLRKADTREGAASRSVRYVQEHHGIPVYNGSIVVGQRKADGRVTSAVNSVDYDLPDTLSTDKVAITAEKVNELLHSRFDTRFQSITAATPTLYIYRHRAPAPADPHRPHPPLRQEMFALATGEEGRAYLAWHVFMDTRGPSGEWELFLDATTGHVIAVNDRRRDFPKASVFWPDPVRSKEDDTISWSTSEATLNNECVEVDLPDLNAPQNNKYKLSGTWVELIDYQAPDFTPPPKPPAISNTAPSRTGSSA